MFLQYVSDLYDDFIYYEIIHNLPFRIYIILFTGISAALLGGGIWCYLKGDTSDTCVNLLIIGCCTALGYTGMIILPILISYICKGILYCTALRTAPRKVKLETVVVDSPIRDGSIC
jgi:hypothetical protein